MSDWPARIARLQLSPSAAALAAERFAAVATRFRHRADAPPAGAWWVPGRIEVLGKHTDYGGGRSLLTTVERGFHLVASPNRDGRVRMVDFGRDAALDVPLAADVPPHPGDWRDYPISVIRRVARDFPTATTGIDAIFDSTLPPASGLSSSSALVVATFLALARFNHLRDSAPWQAALPDDDALAGYLGAVENGKTFGSFPGDQGVGTHGGSEDHTAILRCRHGELSQYHFLPVTPEATVPLPAGWTFAIAMSGVHAAKGSGALANYNRLSGELATLLELWRRSTGRDDPSLFAALRSAPDALARLTAVVTREVAHPEALLDRLEQFRCECDELIPAVTDALRRGDIPALAPLVARSQALAETVLRNQIPETVDLVHFARDHGAAAASAFGAGFGGSVWALVPATEAASFLDRWRDAYLARHPGRGSRAHFFRSDCGPPATEV